MPKAYSYIRFSTPKQASGDSLRRQTARTAEWCAHRGIALDDTLQDLGVSAYRGTNRTTGALRRFLELVENGQIERGSCLIVESLDRLSREAVMVATSRMFDLIRAGITIVTLSDGQEYSYERLQNDWTPLMFSLVVMARAHEESKIKAERVTAAWKHKRVLARADRRPLTSRCPEWLELRDGRFVERLDRVAIVRRIFSETIQGYGRREIVRRLNSECIPAFRGKRGWQTSSVAKIVQSRMVLGEYQPHTGSHRAQNRQPDGDPIPDFYPRVIKLETFWQAQGALQGRRQRAAGRKGHAGPHILQGLARCGSCGAPMHIINKGALPKGGVYLACSNSLRRAGCDSARRWKVSRLESALLSSLGFLEVRAFARLDDNVQPAAERLVVARARLADAETRRARLLVLVETGDDAASERFARVAGEVKALRSAVRRAEAEAAKFAAAPGLVARLTSAADLSRRLESADIDARRDLRIRLSEVVRGLVERVECHEGCGALMVLKPSLAPRVLDGTTPCAVGMKGRVWSALIEPEATDEAIEEFMSTFIGDGNQLVDGKSPCALRNL